MSKTTDYTHTNNPQSIHLAQMAVPFPEWVKGCPIPSAADFVKLASTAFADPEGRRLPLTSKEAAFYSAIDYFANADKYTEDTFEAIKSASEWFGISADIAPYAEAFAAVFEKKAADAEAPAPEVGRFAISTHLNGRDFRLLPLNDAYDIDKSAKDLLKMAGEGRIHYLMFVEASREIVKAASGSVELPPLVQAVGEERFPDLEKAARMIESRRSVVADHEGAFESYAGAVKAAAAGSITAEECMHKIAATDDALGVKYTYNSRARIPLPHDIVYGGPSAADVVKQASQLVMVQSVPVPLSVVQSIPAIDREFKLSKAASAELGTLLGADSNGIDLSLAVEKWAAEDRKELLRLALAASE